MCYNSINDSEMAACDCCLDWYHFCCAKKEFGVDLKKQGDEPYRCDSCEKWFEYKNNTLFPKLDQNILDLSVF